MIDSSRWPYRLQRRLAGVGQREPLNQASRQESCDPVVGMQRMAALLQRAHPEANGQVAYPGLAEDPAYTDYREWTATLPNLRADQLQPDTRRKAFFINLYNALIVDAVCQFQVRRSVREVPGFFFRAGYAIGGWFVDAVQLEYGWLLKNRWHPGVLIPIFRKTDPRRRWSVSSRDFRVHLALVCAARGCPLLNVYSAGGIDHELDLAARSFLASGGLDIDQAAGVIRLSKIFQWYAEDFGAGWMALRGREQILHSLRPFLSQAQQDTLSSLARWRVRFKDYDWTLNGIATR